jgi:hypothetical protein
VINVSPRAVPAGRTSQYKLACSLPNTNRSEATVFSLSGVPGVTHLFAEAITGGVATIALSATHAGAGTLEPVRKRARS